MSEVTLTDRVICNIELAEVITEEDTPQTYYFDTADEANYSPVISEGEEKIKRIKNRIVANNKTEDIQYGSSITLKDNSFNYETLKIVDGGTLTTTESVVTGYSSPVVGAPVTRITFTLNLYASVRDTSGAVIKYNKFSFPKCKGTPAKFSLKDGEFMTPEYTINSRPANGTAPFTVNDVESLPNAEA